MLDTIVAYNIYREELNMFSESVIHESGFAVGHTDVNPYVGSLNYFPEMLQLYFYNSL